MGTAQVLQMCNSPKCFILKICGWSFQSAKDMYIFIAIGYTYIKKYKRYKAPEELPCMKKKHSQMQTLSDV